MQLDHEKNFFFIYLINYLFKFLFEIHKITNNSTYQPTITINANKLFSYKSSRKNLFGISVHSY